MKQFSKHPVSIAFFVTLFAAWRPTNDLRGLTIYSLHSPIVGSELPGESAATPE